MSLVVFTWPELARSGRTDTMPGNEFYHHEQAEQILSEAARLSESVGQGITRDQLLQTAAELGIPPEAVERAEENLAYQAKVGQEVTRENSLRQAYGEEVRRRQKFQWSGWLTTSAVCIAIDLLTTRGLSWSLWVAGIYGVFAVKDLFGWLFGQPENDEAGFRRWMSQRQHLHGRLTELGMTIEQIDMLLESILASGVNEVEDLEDLLHRKTALSEFESHLAVQSFLHRYPDIADKYNVDFDD